MYGTCRELRTVVLPKMNYELCRRHHGGIQWLKRCLPLAWSGLRPQFERRKNNTLMNSQRHHLGIQSGHCTWKHYCITKTASKGEIEMSWIAIWCKRWKVNLSFLLPILDIYCRGRRKFTCFCNMLTWKQSTPIALERSIPCHTVCWFKPCVCLHVKDV